MKTPAGHNYLTFDPIVCYSGSSTETYRDIPRVSLSSIGSESIDENQEEPVKETKKTGKKQYRCGQCLKEFDRPSALKIHMYTHTGEKPHICPNPECNRQFSVISNLRRHLKVHKKPTSGSKKFLEEHKVRISIDRQQGISKNRLGQHASPLNGYQNQNDVNTPWVRPMQMYPTDYNAMFTNVFYSTNNWAPNNNTSSQHITPSSPWERYIYYNPAFYP